MEQVSEVATAAEPAAPSCDAALARAFSFLGKRWNGLILGVLTAGPRTFGQLRRAVAGISDSVLSDRLSELAGVGLVARAVDEGPPVAVTYSLTEAGAGLSPALHELATWAEQNLTGEGCVTVCCPDERSAGGTPAS